MQTKPKIVKEYTHKLIREMESYLKEYFKNESFHLGKVIVSAHERRKRSWGGVRLLNGRDVGYLNLAVEKYVYGPDDYGFEFTHTEYAHIADREDIGTVRGGWKKCLSALVAHEIAHAYVGMHDTEICVNGSFHPTEDEGHDEKWQYVYFLLRRRFCV